MKKILFVIPALTGGGAERVMLHILRHLDRNRFAPLLAVFENKGEMLFDLPSDIPVRVLRTHGGGYGSRFFVFIRLAGLFRQEKPDVVVSFMWYTNLVCSLANLLSGNRRRLVVSERYTLSFSHEGRFEEFLRRFTIRHFYFRADAILVNSKAMGLELEERFAISSGKIAVIYNPVDIQRIRRMAEEQIDSSWDRGNCPVIMASGRLTRQKGFAFLINASGILLSQGIRCRMAILGKGPEEERLKSLAREVAEDSVAFLGFQGNPYKYMSRSSVFVLSSLYEGFPNALLEAQALGVPCVATRCPTGPDEIITEGINGLLVPPADERALAEAIKRLLSDKELREKFSEAGRNKAEEFGVEKIVRQYEDLIENICAGSAGN